MFLLIIHKIIDSIQKDPNMEATCCDDLVNKILQYYEPNVAQQCENEGKSLIQFYFGHLLCTQHCSHFTIADQYTHCQNCHCDFCTPILCRTFFWDMTKSPAEVIDVQDTINQGIPNWFSTSPISLKHLSWLTVLKLMQSFWQSRRTTNCYHIHQVVTLWDLMLVEFPWNYPVHIDPLLLIPGYNEPGVVSSSWDLVASFSRSSLVGGVTNPFLQGHKCGRTYPI